MVSRCALRTARGGRAIRIGTGKEGAGESERDGRGRAREEVGLGRERMGWIVAEYRDAREGEEWRAVLLPASPSGCPASEHVKAVPGSSGGG